MNGAQPERQSSVAGEDWFRAPQLTRVLDLMNRDGAETRIAGGAVRNSLMGLPVHDVDLATTLLPEDVAARARADGIKSVPTGIEHGTVTLVADGAVFEVTTLRRDVETDGRRATVAFSTDWQEDADRRDLTINGLYADREGRVIDLVDGLKDIASGTVRFIGEPRQRIEEDYLRILRFFRFFALYGRHRPDAEGLRACARAKEGLKNLSAERIWSETKKLLAAPDPGRALLWMRQVGVLTEILPETEKWGIDTIPALVDAGRFLGWEPDPLLRLAAIVPPHAERLSALAVRLKLSRAESDFLQDFAAAPIVEETMAGTVLDRLLYRYGNQGLATRLKIAVANAWVDLGAPETTREKCIRLQSLLKRAETFRRPVFPVTGGDILAAGIATGPKVGETLAKLEAIWVDKNFNLTREALLERLNTL